MKNSLSKKWTHLLISVVASSFIPGCGRMELASSENKITNGIEAKESDFPSVVLLAFMTDDDDDKCTGTFVNDSQVVTAAHCVEGLEANNPALSYVKLLANGQEQSIRALSYVRSDKYTIHNPVSPLDVAVINFPAHTAPAVSPIATESPKVGDEFTIVGYGNNVNTIDYNGRFNGSGAGIKRSGSNKISEISDGVIKFSGHSGKELDLTPGENVSSGAGDSGGPLFIDGRLAAVTSAGSFEPGDDGQGGRKLFNFSYYVDLNNSESQSLLRKALKAAP